MSYKSCIAAHAPSDAAWLVVEYVDGGSVQDFVERGGFPLMKKQ